MTETARYATRIYAIGKISKNGWRNHILGWGPDGELDDRVRPLPWPRDTQVPCLPGASYVGPYFLSDDHGCYHTSDGHGVAAGDRACGDAYPGLSRPEVARRCLEAISRATHVFAWIDDPSAYGSLVELGYAKALGKQVHLYMCDERPDLADLWFAGQIAHAHTWVKDAETAWDDFRLRLTTAPTPAAGVPVRRG